MAAFVYYIGDHLWRPSIVTTQTTYPSTGPDYANQANSPINKSATSQAVDSLSATQINNNFYYLAEGLIDSTYRVASLESQKVDSGSATVGMVNYNGCRESESKLYGGSAYVAAGTTQLTFPVTMDASTQLAFRIAVGNGIVYETGGAVSETNSIWHSFTFGEAGSGSPFATPAAMIAYMRTKLIGNTSGSTQTTFSITGTTNPGAQTWRSGTWWTQTFGSLTATPRTVNISINDSTAVSMTFSTNLGSLEAVRVALQNAIGLAINNTNTFAITTPSTNIVVTPSNDRTANGIWQYTLSEPSSGILGWLGLCNGSNTSVSGWNFNTIIDFTATAVSSNYTMNIIGMQSYADFTFMDRDAASTITGLIASWGIPIVNKTIYYHTRAPLSTYSRILNYGGKFIATTMQMTNCIITGSLTYSGVAWTGTQSFTNISVSGTSALSGSTTIGTSSSDTLTIPATATFSNNVTISGSAVIGLNSSNTLSISATTTFNGNVSMVDANAVLSVGTIQLSANGALISAANASFTTATITTLNVANLNSTAPFIVSPLATTNTAGSFNRSSDTPSSTTRTNYNGWLYATRFVMSDSTTTGSGTALYRSTDGSILPYSSDYRLKRDINAIDYGLNEVLKLKPVSFYWKPEYSKETSRNIGFIAQDMLEVIPEVVQGDGSEGTFYGLNPDYLVPVLTKAIQELTQKVKELEARIQ